MNKIVEKIKNVLATEDNADVIFMYCEYMATCYADDNFKIGSKEWSNAIHEILTKSGYYKLSVVA